MTLNILRLSWVLYDRRFRGTCNCISRVLQYSGHSRSNLVLAPLFYDPILK